MQLLHPLFRPTLELQSKYISRMSIEQSLSGLPIVGHDHFGTQQLVDFIGYRPRTCSSRITLQRLPIGVGLFIQYV